MWARKLALERRGVDPQKGEHQEIEDRGRDQRLEQGRERRQREPDEDAQGDRASALAAEPGQRLENSRERAHIDLAIRMNRP